jgi:Ca2+-binding RTX toxin-like protein
MSDTTNSTLNDTLTGGEGDDVLTDNQGTNYLDGGAGADRLTAQSLMGNQTLVAGSGNDSLNASYLANALLQGDEGDDSLSINNRFT